MHSAPHSRFRGPWVVVALAALGVVVLALGVVHFSPPSCAAVTSGQAAAHVQAAAPVQAVAAGQSAGQADFYNPAQAEDRCSIEPLTSNGLYVSLPPTQYANGAECGAYLDIRGPLGMVQAEIIDMCPGCGASQLDLSAAAFARIQQPSLGTAQISYQLALDPALPGPLAVRIGSGSTAGSLALQVLNHGNPLSAVQVNSHPLTLRADGYWIAPAGAGSGPFQVRVTDTAGHTVVLTGITLRPGTVQETAVLMYSITPTSPPPPPPPQPQPAPAPSPAIQRASNAASEGSTPEC
jgi:expansin